MFGCVGEDYSTLETIRLTGGIAPDATWEQNWTNIRATAALAQQLGLKLVTFHAGFLPHEEKDPNFAKLLRRLAETADVFQAANIALGLETGQETAPVLVQLLQKLNRPNVGVNFDPANMILYDKGDPIAALRVLGPWIRQVHIKDARRTKVPGTWGEEVAGGHGRGGLAGVLCDAAGAELHRGLCHRTRGRQPAGGGCAGGEGDGGRMGDGCELHELHELHGYIGYEE